jgi:nitrate reductase NapAB chaperone NapD
MQIERFAQTRLFGQRSLSVLEEVEAVMSANFTYHEMNERTHEERIHGQS